MVCGVGIVGIVGAVGGTGSAVGAVLVGGGRAAAAAVGTAHCTALIVRNYSVAAYNMVAARLTDLRATDSTQVPFKK